MSKKSFENFPKILRLRRKQLRLTHEQLAELCDTTHGSTQRWETGQTKPDFIRFLKLAKALNMRPEELAGLEPIEPRVITPTPTQALDVLREALTGAKPVADSYIMKTAERVGMKEHLDIFLEEMEKRAAKEDEGSEKKKKA